MPSPEICGINETDSICKKPDEKLLQYVLVTARKKGHIRATALQRQSCGVVQLGELNYELLCRPAK